MKVQLTQCKLGYGGTKTEMERLLADAEKISGVHYDISNLDDVYNAIHVIQQELGVTGTTALEASQTLSGSFSSMKAAFKDFLGNLALGNDIKPSLTALVETASTFLFDNLLPAIGNIIKQLPSAISTFIQSAGPALAEKGVELLKQIGQGIVRGAFNLINNFGEALDKLLEFQANWEPGDGQAVAQKILEAIGNAIMTIVPALCAKLGEALDKLIELITNWDPVGAAEGGNQIMDAIGRGIRDNAPTILKAIGTVLGKLGLLILQSIPRILAFLGIMLGHLGLFLLQKLGQLVLLIPQGLLALLRAVWELIKTEALTAWEGIKTVIMIPINAIKNLILTVWNAIKTFLMVIWTGIKTVAKSVWNVIKTVITTPINTVRAIIQSVWNAIKSFVQGVWNGIKATATSIWNGIKTAITTPIQAARNLILNIINGIKTTISSVFNAIKTTASNIWNGIKNAITKPIETAKNTIKGILDKIKGFFPLSIGKIFSNLKIPHISVSGGEAPFGIAGKGSLPKFSVTWNAKAMSDPFMFSGATLFGAGEAGDEILYGRRALMHDIQQATQNTSTNDARTNAILRRMDLILDELEKGHTISVGHRDFARLVNEVS